MRPIKKFEHGGVHPTEKELRKFDSNDMFVSYGKEPEDVSYIRNQRDIRKAANDNRLLFKYLDKQERKGGPEGVQGLLDTLENPEGFDRFKGRRKIMGGLGRMAGLGVLGSLVGPVSRSIRRRDPLRHGSQYASSAWERIFPKLFGIN
jgi:hypothetical protein|tara:strand:- start:499 stop:942 length:444 start_codon:yes stop_codon:yes gene_type:complete